MPAKSSYVRISGGLGNQLFQYAFSRTLAIGSGSSVLLDLERYSLDAGENARKCEISNLFPYAIFSHSAKYSTASLLLGILPSRLKDNLLAKREYKIRMSKIFKGRKVVLESNIPYDASIPLQDENYYVGNFISPEYWWGNLKLIIDEVDQAVSISALSADTLLPPENVIAIHIRRGDYLENKKTREFHGYCKETYYLEALKKLRKMNGSLDSVLISSDNHTYACYFSSKLQELGFQVSILENLNPICTLYVLSRAHYFVGSNSTFSWWAAFLGTQKSTVFPKRWFMDENIEIIPHRFYPIMPFLLDDALTSEPINGNHHTKKVER
jgi:Glycosyl transferase family 11